MYFNLTSLNMVTLKIVLHIKKVILTNPKDNFPCVCVCVFTFRKPLFSTFYVSMPVLDIYATR